MLMYGRGVASIAEQIHGTYEEAQKITNDFFNAYPKVRQWIDKTIEDAHKNGYVEDLWGRRRRLPDIQLPKYEIKMIKEESVFNPLLYCKGIVTSPGNSLIDKYAKLADKCRTRKDYQNLQYQARNEGVSIRENGGFISQAERQCVNARVQGGASSMSKRAMIAVHNDNELKELGFKLLICVHDELIGECPKENAEKVADRLSFLMMHSAEPECVCPFKCDCYIVSRWYEDDFSDTVNEQYNKLIKSGKDSQTAFSEMKQEYSMINEEYLREMCSGEYVCAVHDNI